MLVKGMMNRLLAFFPPARSPMTDQKHFERTMMMYMISERTCWREDWHSIRPPLWSAVPCWTYFCVCRLIMIIVGRDLSTQENSRVQKFVHSQYCCTRRRYMRDVHWGQRWKERTKWYRGRWSTVDAEMCGVRRTDRCRASDYGVRHVDDRKIYAVL